MLSSDFKILNVTGLKVWRKQLRPTLNFMQLIPGSLVSYADVLGVVTKTLLPTNDDTKNGCGGEYRIPDSCITLGPVARSVGSANPG